MAKVPFSPEGVAAKTAGLYALDDAALYTEAQLAGSDFRSWFEDNFELATSQQEYLDEVPASFLLFWGYVFGAAFIGRRPIAMSGLPDEPRRTKEILTSATSAGSYTPVRNGQPAQLYFGGEVGISFAMG